MTASNPWTRPPEIEAVLAIGALTLFAAVTVGVLLHVVPPENEKYAMLMLGALIGVVKDTFGRYFQATKGAQEQRIETAKVAATLAAGAVASTSSDVVQAADMNVQADNVTVESKP